MQISGIHFKERKQGKVLDSIISNSLSGENFKKGDKISGLENQPAKKETKVNGYSNQNSKCS